MPGLTLTLEDGEYDGDGEASAGLCVEVGFAGATFEEALSLGVGEDEAVEEASPGVVPPPDEAEALGETLESSVADAEFDGDDEGVADGCCVGACDGLHHCAHDTLT